MNDIIIKEVSIEEIVKINSRIVEFGKPYEKDYFEDRYTNKKKLMILAYINGKPAGYIIGYDKFGDDSFYCWMAGVDPIFRKMGILKELMKYQEKWAKSHSYKSIKITTRNSRRNMLGYLVKYGFFFTKVNPHLNILDNRIELEKIL